MSTGSPAELQIGLIGCDTSHCTAFAEMLNDKASALRLPGAKITKAYKGGSPDFALSANRVESIAGNLAAKYQVELVPSIEQAIAGVDAILLESVDGRVHLDQFKICAQAGKPVFIDKPLEATTAHAREIAAISERTGAPFFSSSGLRWAYDLNLALVDNALGEVTGIDVQGPMAFEPPLPDYFWYGIHPAEMVYRAMGMGCVEVMAHSTEAHDVIVGTWKDGRVATIRGNRCGNSAFAGTLHRKKGSVALPDACRQAEPFYRALLQQVLTFFRSGISPVTIAEMIEVVRFLEAAGESRAAGGRFVTL